MFVADLRGGGMVVGNHALPVGVVPTQLLWAKPDELVITLPAGEDATGAPEVNMVSVDPLTSGPVSMGGEPLYGRYRIAPGSQQGYVTVLVAADGTTTVSTRSDATSDAISPPAWSVEIGDDGPREPVAIAEDGSGTVWVTLADGAGEAQIITTWRVSVVDDQAGSPRLLTGEFVAVAATPFDGTPVTTDEPTSTTTASPTTEPISTTTAPREELPAFVYLTSTGRVVRQRLGEGPVTLAELPLPAVGDTVGLSPFPVDSRIAVSPDGETVYVAVDQETADLCAAVLYAVSVNEIRTVEIAAGYAPAVSPDGSKLAYVESTNAEDRLYCESVLVVRDLATGAERRWNDPPDALIGGARLTGLSWSTDNRTLAFSRSWEGDSPYLHDTDSPEGDLPVELTASLDFGPRLTTEPPRGGLLLLDEVTAVDGTPAIVFESSCYDVDVCGDQDVLRLVPLDGSPHVDRSVDPGGTDFRLGPHGYLYLGCGAGECQRGLMWEDTLGTRTPLVSSLVEAAAWLP